jgi:hypothetical protein
MRTMPRQSMGAVAKSSRACRVQASVAMLVSSWVCTPRSPQVGHLHGIGLLGAGREIDGGGGVRIQARLDHQGQAADELGLGHLGVVLVVARQAGQQFLGRGLPGGRHDQVARHQV